MKKKKIAVIIIISVLVISFFAFVISLLDKELIFAIIYIFFILCIGGGTMIYISILTSKKEKTRKNLPPKIESATVKDKNTEFVGNRYSIRTKYFVTFETQFGYRMCFEVEQDEYALLSINDKGVLTYKESEDNLFFEDFTAN